MEIIFNDKKYRYKDNQWHFLDEDDADGGFLIKNVWYHVINKDRIKELNNLIRVEKIKRVLCLREQKLYHQHTK